MIKAAKRVEKGRNYSKKKAVSNPYVEQKDQNVRVKSFTETWQEHQNRKSSNDALEELTKRFEKMEIKLLDKLQKKEELTCFKCGKTGHKMDECKEVKCYKCGKQGHTSKICKEECKLCGQSSHVTEKCYRNFKCEKCGKIGHTRKFCREEVRRVNYTIEEEASEDEYYAITDDEEELYLTTRSGRTYKPKPEKPVVIKREKKVKVRQDSDDDMMDVDEEKIKVKRIREKSKIEKMKGYDIVEDLEKSNANITFAQILQDPTQKKLLKEALKGIMHQELADE